jgi:NCAIR mutase (PurE)-related protein
MNAEEIRSLLTAVLDGRQPLEDAVKELSAPSLAFLKHAKLDLARESRCGFEEVVLAERKSWPELREIVSALISARGRALITRIPEAYHDRLEQHFPDLRLYPRARLACCDINPLPRLPGRLAVVSAGTSDAPVAGEAAESARYFGLEVTEINDVGVAGLERLTTQLEGIREHDVVIVVAGMEGALAGVLGGLCQAPLIAVPTSVGYGASLGGITTLFSMLISCSPGLTVVNIDNGFGAALAAARMVKHLRRGEETTLSSEPKTR